MSSLRKIKMNKIINKINKRTMNKLKINQKKPISAMKYQKRHQRNPKENLKKTKFIAMTQRIKVTKIIRKRLSKKLLLRMSRRLVTNSKSLIVTLNKLKLIKNKKNFMELIKNASLRS